MQPNAGTGERQNTDNFQERKKTFQRQPLIDEFFESYTFDLLSYKNQKKEN